MPEPTYPLVRDLACVECGREWEGPVERWRVYLTEDDPPQPVTYCQACAEPRVRLDQTEMPGCAGPPTYPGTYHRNQQVSPPA